MDIGDVPLLGHKVHPHCNRLNNVGIELRDLQKTYGHHKVVKNLNLKLYRNEITVLLGHNGAGKSTTLNMLTGIIPPTAGTALINGKDICTEVEAARRSLGICPQHDVLFADMTVRHHIVFFSRLKGVRGEDVEKEVQKYMQIMELEHKSKVTAKNLSGGMKRKLCLCCALCGNTRAVLCDEPSSGIDAAGRRRLWDLLLTEKIGRTVLLTTHYMDEANVLGDRIAILSNGELQCYGTPFDLKKRYGLGYRLVCVTEDGCDVDALTELMAKHIPNIQPESTVASEVIYRLPSEYTSKYAALLNDLDRESQELKLDGYGISVATIEDVFVKMNLTKNTLMNSLNVKKEDQRQFRNLSIFDLKLPDRNLWSRFIMHCQALIYKNVWITLRNYWILIAQILIPIVFTSLIILNSRGGRIYYELPEILISPMQYRQSFAVVEDRTSNSSLADAYASYVESFGNRFALINTDMPFEDFILETAKGRRQTSKRIEGGAGSRSSDPHDKDGIRAEIQRIQNFTDEELNQMPLVVDSISKRYGKFIAVNNLSFFVNHGECFGLLGINGAGKTTTFKMLTGDSKITSGSAYVVGLNLKTQMRKVFPKIGYCPQFNALFEELTGRETLRIFCLLRCIQRHRIKRICNDLANFFGFQPHVDKRVKHYSGGNKRKLSVAIAFIGNPMVLYLDEPTCGMDPSAQRQLWQILATIRSYGKSSVLTTHSMEECEALCTRIAIMISGQLKCIGSIQQIKNNYSKGLILKIRLEIAYKKFERSVVKDKKRRPNKELSNEDIETISTDTKRVRKMKDFIAEKVPDAVLREEVNDLLTYLLPTESVAWSEIFQLMESNRERLHIEDYVITQTRLEEIFLNFVWDDMNQSLTDRN
ncbi:uncharacterized protein Dwil_GK21220 [Drosophila willistoni]|uniref:ABC transporter domain-containing protein n=1 Tax=Drosophila willistoni TaxID=7260 RepID=A0A0Q9WVK7_DROWI|nr:uncharacterized protein Dwil_GK21220 [Drosophila willistoni]